MKISRRRVRHAIEQVERAQGRDDRTPTLTGPVLGHLGVRPGEEQARLTDDAWRALHHADAEYRSGLDWNGIRLVMEEV
jgi:hypothetical protein